MNYKKKLTNLISFIDKKILSTKTFFFLLYLRGF